ncbi:hypothetical protein [Streptomyces sp. NPDC005209]|uniref:hypothetical protein n=1 Tax=Streptomyces sp. NPDC005209 TaxID=3156715 RepID=UPI0033B3DE51
MTPWLRCTFRVARLLLVLAAVVLPYGATASYAAESTPSGSPAGSPSGSSSGSSSRVPAGSPSGSRSPSSRAPSSRAASASASAEPSRAGSLAGEGKVRPGRPDGPAEEIEGDQDDTPADQDGGASQEAADPGEGDETAPGTSDAPSAPAASDTPREAGLVPSAVPPRQAHDTVTHAGEDASEPVLRILPLGSGLVLIGLGLGLAFVALRVRRG